MDPYFDFTYVLTMKSALRGGGGGDGSTYSIAVLELTGGYTVT